MVREIPTSYRSLGRAPTTDPSCIGEEVRAWELSFVQAVGCSGGGLCQNPLELGQRDKDTNPSVQLYGSTCEKCLMTPSGEVFAVTFSEVEPLTRLQKGAAGWREPGPFGCRPWSEGTGGAPLPVAGLERLFWISSWAQFVAKVTCDFVFAC